MDFHLTVIEPFGGYAKGDEITDLAKVAEILDGENAHHVVKRVAAAGDSPKAAKSPA
ncbi:hypothetical protein [Burkholderia ubonensis]|uniref:hypothetical protein n=1 Tax=Burkholderia ubonensis TaxID=101571 RepID=UPI000AC37971|nr:hypothetical protein [Burkholderia ubonensis]